MTSGRLIGFRAETVWKSFFYLKRHPDPAQHLLDHSKGFRLGVRRVFRNLQPDGSDPTALARKKIQLSSKEE